MFKHAWTQRAEQAQTRINTLKNDLKAIEKEIAQLLDRAISASIPRKPLDIMGFRAV